MAKFHAGDLFYIEAKASDLAEHTRLLCPSLVSYFGSSSAGEGLVVDVASPVSLTGDQMKPLKQLIGGLLHMVDDKVHIQQMAATSRAW